MYMWFIYKIQKQQLFLNKYIKHLEWGDAFIHFPFRSICKPLVLGNMTDSNGLVSQMMRLLLEIH